MTPGAGHFSLASACSISLRTTRGGQLSESAGPPLPHSSSIRLEGAWRTKAGVKAQFPEMRIRTRGCSGLHMKRLATELPACRWPTRRIPAGTQTDIGFLRSYANLLGAAIERLRVVDELRGPNASLRLSGFYVAWQRP
jgi:hypothetical protein